MILDIILDFIKTYLISIFFNTSKMISGINDMRIVSQYFDTLSLFFNSPQVVEKKILLTSLLDYLALIQYSLIIDYFDWIGYFDVKHWEWQENWPIDRSTNSNMKTIRCSSKRHTQFCCVKLDKVSDLQYVVTLNVISVFQINNNKSK